MSEYDYDADRSMEVVDDWAKLAGNPNCERPRTARAGLMSRLYAALARCAYFLRADRLGDELLIRSIFGREAMGDSRARSGGRA